MEITYEILFEALMLEKNRPELQKLDKDFFIALNAYINDKKKILEDKKATLDMFSESEKEKTSKQLINIRKIVKELYERRERKILDMALTRSRTGSAVMDTSALRDEEKAMFSDLTGFLDRHRQITFSAIEAQEEGFKKPNALVREEVMQKNGLAEEQEGKEPLSQAQEAQLGKDQEEEKEHEKKEDSIKVIRFIHSVPRFLGKELEVYGPFEEEDISTLPSEIAEILIRKGRAEEISG